jgi:DNA repair protein RecO (recombination protein O)
VTRSGRRVELAALYVLHHRPWRDTSRMLEVFARDQGRLTLFARGVRGPRSRSASMLQPFRLLMASWSGTGDTGQLSQVERAHGDDIRELPAAALMSAYYLNELLLKLTLRADPQPQVFDLYHEAICALRDAERVEPVLRRFERQLLELLGYGLELNAAARDGGALKADAYYHFHPDLGFVEVGAESAGSTYTGAALSAFALDDYSDPAVLEQARRVMRIALDHALEGRELRTRGVARAVVRKKLED